MKTRNWNDDYVNRTTCLFFSWVLLNVGIVLFVGIVPEIYFFLGTAFGWMTAVFASRAINDKL